MIFNSNTEDSKICLFSFAHNIFRPLKCKIISSDCKINYSLADCLGGQIGGVPPLANRVEKLVCLEIIVARILNLYIGNVSERQSDSPIKGNVAKRQKGCRFRRKAGPYGDIGNVCFLAVGTRRAVSAVAIKLYRLNRSFREKLTFP